MLKRKLIVEDDFKWAIPRTRNTGSRVSILEEEKEREGEVLKYVGGVDISFSKEDPSVACGILLVLDLHTLQVVYEDSSLVTLNVPYVPGFLAFREVCFLCLFCCLNFYNIVLRLLQRFSLGSSMHFDCSILSRSLCFWSFWKEWKIKIVLSTLRWILYFMLIIPVLVLMFFPVSLYDLSEKVVLWLLASFENFVLRKQFTILLS